MYAKDADGLYVNLFIGSTVDVGQVAGTPLRLVQKTDYPWSGKVLLTVNPAKARKFSIRIRVPNRNVSALYSATPADGGLKSLKVNGENVDTHVSQGYAAVTRKWMSGDTVEFELPLQIQRVRASDKIAADAGKIALRYGPLVYNIESADQDITQSLSDDAPLSTQWRGDLLGGLVVIKGTFADGSALTAIPNYARNNRVPASTNAAPASRFATPPSIVWMREK